MRHHLRFKYNTVNAATIWKRALFTKCFTAIQYSLIKTLKMTFVSAGGSYQPYRLAFPRISRYYGEDVLLLPHQGIYAKTSYAVGRLSNNLLNPKLYILSFCRFSYIQITQLYIYKAFLYVISYSSQIRSLLIILLILALNNIYSV